MENILLFLCSVTTYTVCLWGWDCRSYYGYYSRWDWTFSWRQESKRWAKKILLVSILSMPFNVEGYVFTILGNAVGEKGVYSLVSFYQKTDGNALTFMSPFVYQDAKYNASIVVGIGAIQNAGKEAVTGMGIAIQRAKDAFVFLGIAKQNAVDEAAMVSGIAWQNAGNEAVTGMGIAKQNAANKAVMVFGIAWQDAQDALVACGIAVQNAENRATAYGGISLYQYGGNTAETFAGISIYQRTKQSERTFGVWSTLPDKTEEARDPSTE